MPSLPALQPDYHDRHVKLLGKLGSDCETECAPTAQLADEHRHKCGLTWGESVLAAPDAAQPERKIRKLRT